MGEPTDLMTGALEPALRPSGEQPQARVTRREAMLGWMDIAPYGIFTTDAEFRVLSWNGWLVAHSGLTEQAVLGHSVFELFPDITRRGLDQHFRRALAGEVAVLSTALHRYLLPIPPMSREYDIEHMLQTVRIAPLPSVGTITILEDVTQRECQAVILRRQQEHDRLLSSALALLLQSERPLDVMEELFPRLAAPLKLEAYINYVVTPNSTEMRLNAAGGISPEAHRTLGVTTVHGAGACSRVARLRVPVIIPRLQTNTDPMVDSMRRLGFRSYAGFPLVISDRLIGTLAFGSYSREEILPEEVSFLSTVAQYLAVAIDRSLRETALREARQRLAQHAESLESKVTERTARLHETIEQLESFSYTIAHDLRAPIRSLKGYAEVLSVDYGSSLPAEANGILQRLHRASDRLDALTRDLLRFSKIVREDVKLAPVDLAELIDDVVLLTPALQADVIAVHFPLGRVQAQRTLLQQCVSNLFDNALKFAQPGMKPRITVRTEIVDGGLSSRATSHHPFNSATSAGQPGPSSGPVGPRRRIWVEDNGIGIPAEAHEKIFGIFERVSGLENIEGTGIGLAIVARAMQQMGGACGVESTLGHGARFWLDLLPAD